MSGEIGRKEREEDQAVERGLECRLIPCAEVVDDAAVLVAAQGVLRLARGDAVEVVGEAGVQEVLGAAAGDQRVAQVRHVEEADALTHGRVLGDDTAAGVLDRHRPAAEVGHLGAERHVLVVQGGRLRLLAHAS